MRSEYFSSYFGVKRTARATWFDPILGADTKLFVDPFLIYREIRGEWATAHDEVIAYFQRSFKLLAPVHDKPKSPGYQKVLQLMAFPEPQYFGLGYVSEGQNGAGTGQGFAQRIVDAMGLAIARGIQDITHFEELSLLVERIGRDRISDITCNILIRRFITYTQRICQQLAVPMEPQKVPRGSFDEIRKRWVPATENLPKNPISGLPILLTPKRFLAELPQLNADDWFDHNADELRTDYNLDVNQRLDKESIVRAARERPELIKKWADAASDRVASPYDVENDPAGYHDWLALAVEYAAQNQLQVQTPATGTEMMDFIEQCCKKFQHFIEQRAGWKLLWNDDTARPKKEDSIQLLFRGIIESYCDAAGIRLDREVDVGRGPVDFTFTATATLRALLEIKRMSSSSFWDGLESQLTAYMNADQTKFGWYLPVRFSDSKNEQARAAGLSARVQAAKTATGFDIRALAIDARRPQSASKLRKARSPSS